MLDFVYLFKYLFRIKFKRIKMNTHFDSLYFRMTDSRKNLDDYILLWRAMAFDLSSTGGS